MRLLALILLAFSFAVAPSLQAKPTSTPSEAQRGATPTEAQPVAQPRGSSTEEIAVLKAQLATSKEFNASILSTVYWALGGTFVLVGLLLGFGWLANFKVYERDKGAMQAELLAAINSKAIEIESSTSAKLADIHTLVDDNVKLAVLASHENIKQQVDGLSRKIFKIELIDLKERMRSNPSDNMAMTDALELFHLCAERAPDEIPDIMHFMLRTIDKGGKLTASEINHLNQLLDELPAHYRTLTEKLRAKLVASDIF